MANTVKTIKAWYINPSKGIAEVREIVDDIHTFYDLLDCRCIDIPSRRFIKSNGKTSKYYSIICDDEGLFSEDPYISAVDFFGRTMLVGSLLVVGESDDEGNLTSLDDSDVRFLKRHTELLGTQKHPEPYPMLVSMTY